MRPTVRLAFSPMPAHVRTARLVAVAAARQRGVDEGLLDEIRLAVGEACSRAVGRHRAGGLDALVEVECSGGTRFAVTVRDRAPAEQAVPDGPDGPAGATSFVGEGLSEEEVAAEVGLALLRGLAEDVSVTAADGGGTVVRMSWPLG